MKILLVGPCAPEDLSEMFYEEDSFRAKEFSGYRGIPVSLLAKALIEAGYEVVVLTTAEIPRGATTIFRGFKIEVHIVSSRKRARDRALTLFRSEIKTLSKKIIEINPDIVHAHWTYEFALAALAAGKPVLITAHDAPLTIFRNLYDPYRFFRLLMAFRVRIKTKHLTVVSPYLLQRWRKEMFWRRAVSVIPNISPFPNIPLKLQTEPTSRVLAISDSGKLKNIKSLLLAWVIVLQKTPSAHLDLIGHGLGENDSLAKRAAEKGLGDSVTWHGYKERDFVSEILTSSDIFVSPSLEESFGLTFLEAMEHSVPVVGGISSGAVPFVVADAGLLVNVRKPFEIAEAIIRLLEDEELRRSFGIRGRIRAREAFSADVIARQYIEEYKKILGVANV
jgi:glycosyltransferase involved in cell wall biosynthesis